MLLAKILQEIRDESKGKIPGETWSLMKKATNELRDSGIMDTALQKGDIIPPFELPNSSGMMISSQELLKKGNVVLTFYRGVW